MEEVGCICRPGETCNCFDKLPNTGNIPVSMKRVVEDPEVKSQQAQSKQTNSQQAQREADAIMGRFKSVVKSANQIKAGQEAKNRKDGIWNENIEKGKKDEIIRIAREKKNLENWAIMQKKKEANNEAMRKFYENNPEAKKAHNREEEEKKKAEKEKAKKDAAILKNAMIKNPLLMQENDENDENDPNKDFSGGKRRSRRSRSRRSRSRRSRSRRSRSRRSRRKTRRIKKTH